MIVVNESTAHSKRKKHQNNASPSPRTQIVDALECRELNGTELKVFEFVCGGALATVETVSEKDLHAS
jgi:hypothetical protein